MIQLLSIQQAAIIAIGLTAVVGCQGPFPPGQYAQSGSSTPGQIVDTQNIAFAEGVELSPQGLGKKSAVDAATLAMEGQQSPAKTQEAAMAEVLADLEEIGAIDPSAKQKLLTDLKEAKPENWPLIVQLYKSTLAYRQQLLAKETQGESDGPFAPAKSNRTQAIQASHEITNTSAATKTPEANKLAVQEPKASAVMVSDGEASAQMPESDVAMRTAKPLPKPVISNRQQAKVVAVPSQHKIEQVSYQTPIASVRGWQEHLQAAITSLEKSAVQNPSNTAEVHDHMRLRMLRMLAGEEENALTPIPGASSIQQDYWAKQLFAVSTFLDNESQPDTKRRAAGSLVQLDQARANLSELATLQIRNLTFVDSVDGFGVYQPRVSEKFKPGDQVTLYTEVDNFRSESTKEGYRTLLGTSYEVLDAQGQRVDSAQFPDVEDLCQNRRNDFHMQYGVALPTRIYPGEYQLRITVTDQLSHKISQSSVPFEIVE